MNYQIACEVCGVTNTYESQYSRTVDLEAVQPIECDAQFQTLQFQPLRQLPAGESCVALVTVSNMCPFSLLLDQGMWKFDSLLTSQPTTSQLAGLTLRPGEKANDVAVLLVAECDNQDLRPGSYSLKWKRF